MEVVTHSKDFYNYFRDQAQVILNSKLCPFFAKTEFINSTMNCKNFNEYLNAFLRLEKSYELANI